MEWWWTREEDEAECEDEEAVEGVAEGPTLMGVERQLGWVDDPPCEEEESDETWWCL